MVKISAVIITYNEARNIGRCLDSIREIADDVVVVDSFSTDQTAEICRSKGVRFIEHAFEGHIEQKNWALSQALYPYVLSLDADEALSPTLQQSIRKVKMSGLDKAYTMNRLTSYCGQWIRHCGWYPDRKLRLFDRTAGTWGGTNPHDKVELKEGVEEGFLEGDLLHYSYYTVDEHNDRARKYAAIAANAMFRAGKKSSWGQVIFSPLAKFIRIYLIKGGFWDGWAGLKISLISAKETYWRYRSLLRLR
jgi:glycosyltransferase involved in cell wall biosynthesis